MLECITASDSEIEDSPGTPINDWSLERRVIKVDNPDYWKPKIEPQKLCVNNKTNQLAVDCKFFWQVWNDWKTDDTWHAWVAVQNEKAIGTIVLQQFVHESNYFAWGPPLNKLCPQPDPITGEIEGVAEISVFCAKGCGTLLLNELERFVKEETNYEWIVVCSTEGAADWYKSKNYQDIRAYRLPPPYTKKNTDNRQHLYVHRIADANLISSDEPSIMMYKHVNRTKTYYLRRN